MNMPTSEEKLRHFLHCNGDTPRTNPRYYYSAIARPARITLAPRPPQALRHRQPLPLGFSANRDDLEDTSNNSFREE